MNVFEKIGRWLTPYKYTFDEVVEIETKEKNRKKRKVVKNRRPILAEKEQKELSDLLERGEIGIDVILINQEMTKEAALDRLMKSATHNAYFIHTEKHHQLAVKFEKGSAWRFYERSNNRRAKLKPLVQYREKGKSDKTHLIPIGFHGSENDERLLVDFDSKINRYDLKKFEEYISNANATDEVLWFVDIVRQDDETVVWKACVWDNQGHVIKEQEFHDKNKFIWR